MDRFSRIEKLLGSASFERLRSRYVVVVGLGAVGGYVVEGLARSGIGRLRLVDFDVITRSNINRQILALESTLDRAKCEVAEERVRLINPSCRVEGMRAFADEETLHTILEPRPDMVIDAIDSLGPKVLLLRTAHQLGIPTLSSMGAALRTDPGKIAFADLAQTRGCPLARRVRQRLRKYGIEQGIGCVYSSEPVDFTYAGPERDDTAPGEWRGCPRNVLGSLPTLTGIFGLTLANQAILQLSCI
ncbi:MAG: tRNA threonylcarbamoyladenosine dehydratase [Desulfobulbus sp.]|nr:tRNA threonylcarbamoyladenosine dehydratase [Desulfobulbus sp.]